MFSTTFGRFGLGAAALVLISTFAAVRAQAPQTATPLGAAIAAQGNRALQDIREDVRNQLRRQRPSPLQQFQADQLSSDSGRAAAEAV